VDIAAEIEIWEKQNAEKLNSPFASESFGGYAYSLKSSISGDSGGNGIASGTVFEEKLKQWRKIRYESAIRRNEYVRHTQ
jgi:hypothetical protein